jgi:uncharacterized paraquat-inducible protein A
VLEIQKLCTKGDKFMTEQKNTAAAEDRDGEVELVQCSKCMGCMVPEILENGECPYCGEKLTDADRI